MKALKSNGIECMIITLCFFCAAVIGGCDGDDSTTITPSWLFVQTAPSGTLSSNATAQASAAAEYTL